MADIENNDIFVIHNKKDLEHALQRIKDQHDGNTYTKPKIFTKREHSLNDKDKDGSNKGDLKWR